MRENTRNWLHREVHVCCDFVAVGLLIVMCSVSLARWSVDDKEKRPPRDYQSLMSGSLHASSSFVSVQALVCFTLQITSRVSNAGAHRYVKAIRQIAAKDQTWGLDKTGRFRRANLMHIFSCENEEFYHSKFDFVAVSSLLPPLRLWNMNPACWL